MTGIDRKPGFRYNFFIFLTFLCFRLLFVSICKFLLLPLRGSALGALLPAKQEHHQSHHPDLEGKIGQSRTNFPTRGNFSEENQAADKAGSAASYAHTQD